MKTFIHISLVAGCILFMVSCRNTDLQNVPDVPTIRVKIVHAKMQNTSFPIRCSGTISSKTEVKLSFKTGGIIHQIFVDEGMSVRKDQLLAQLNLSEISAMVDQARLAFEKAERDLRRAENLHADSVATLEQLQNAQTAVSLAKSQLGIAEFNKEHSMIKAPSDGKILKKLGEQNETIAAGHPLFLFSSSESDWVFRTSLADVDIVKIQFGDSAIIQFDAFPGETFNATVSEIAEASDPYTGTYEVELRLRSAFPKFISGLIGSAIITPAIKQDYLTIPIRALHEAEGMTGFVYLINESTFERRQVDIAAITDSLFYITGSLNASDRIIADGAEYLLPGANVQIVD